MNTWIIITLAAAFLQNLRSVFQKKLKSVMGTTGATFVRFGFGAPFALLFLFGLQALTGHPLPSPNAAFLGWVILAALAQIGAQALLVHLFSLRNFAVGTAYSRTEPAQAAVFSLLLLGEGMNAGAVAAIIVSMIGVLLISVARDPFSVKGLITSLNSRTALIGMASGAGFGLAATGYRAASLALGRTMAEPDFLMQAATVLVWAILLQSALMLGWIFLKEPEELPRIRAAWKMAALVGLVGASASFGWFAAMTLQKAAIVKALAQVEMLLAFGSSVFIFRERINRLELAGCGLIVAGILALVISR